MELALGPARGFVVGVISLELVKLRASQVDLVQGDQVANQAGTDDGNVLRLWVVLQKRLIAFPGSYQPAPFRHPFVPRTEHKRLYGIERVL